MQGCPFPPKLEPLAVRIPDMSFPSSSRGFSILIVLVVGVSLSALAQEAVVGPVKPETNAGRCPANASILTTKSGAPGWNGWGVDPHNRRFQPAAQAGLTGNNVPRLRLKWAFGFAGASIAFSQPAVVGGRLIVGSESGDVFALKPDSGCIEWTFHAQGSVRTGFVVGPGSIKRAQSGVVYLGDQHGFVYALDSATGQLLWKVQADLHPAAMITGTPQLWQGRLAQQVCAHR